MRYNESGKAFPRCGLENMRDQPGHSVLLYEVRRRNREAAFFIHLVFAMREIETEGVAAATEAAASASDRHTTSCPYIARNSRK